jgi:hypothetical protein
MKNIGVVVDNYKLDKFKDEFIKHGFTDMAVFKFTRDTSTIKLFNVPDSRVNDIAQICKRMELHFKRSN